MDTIARTVAIHRYKNPDGGLSKTHNIGFWIYEDKIGEFAVTLETALKVSEAFLSTPSGLSFLEIQQFIQNLCTS